MIEIPLHTLTLYADLAQRLATAPREGSVYSRTISGVEYLYAKVRAGAGRADVYLGRADDPSTQAQVAGRERGTALAKERRRTIAMLVKGGLPVPDRTLGSTLSALNHAGLFNRGAVLVGTAAYLLSSPLAGHVLPAPTMMTGDVDIAAASLTLSAEEGASLQEVLRWADPSFESIMQLDGRDLPSRFRNEGGYLVELLTPRRTRDDRNPLPLPALDAGAIPIQQLAWLITEAVDVVALWGTGVMVKVPQPARYAVHKLIVAQKRLDQAGPKRRKDLAQAAALIQALKRHDPYALEDAIEDARSQGPDGWAEPIARSLREIGVAL